MRSLFSSDRKIDELADHVLKWKGLLFSQGEQISLYSCRYLPYIPSFYSSVSVVIKSSSSDILWK